jgi:hypothetical protein
MITDFMCLRLVFLLITRFAAWLRLSRREEAQKIAEIVILRQQLVVLQRQPAARPKLAWADRALLAALAGVIPKVRRQGLRLLAARTRTCAATAPSPAAGATRSMRGRTGRPATRRNIKAWSAGSHARTPDGGTAGSTVNGPAWEPRVAAPDVWEILKGQRRRSRPATTDRLGLAAVPALPGPGQSSHATSSAPACAAAPRPASWP